MFYDPSAEVDDLSQRILAIEYANGVGMSARQIREVGRLACDEDTINRRRRKRAYQNALTELRKDAIGLIKANQSRAILKLAEQINNVDPKIAQRAALFFGQATMDVAMKQADLDMQDEQQRRERLTPPRRIVIEFEMDPSIVVLGEPAKALPAPATAGDNQIESQVNQPATPPPDAPRPPDDIPTTSPELVGSPGYSGQPNNVEIPIEPTQSSIPQMGYESGANTSNGVCSTPAATIPDREQPPAEVPISAVPLPIGNELEGEDADILGGIQ